MKLSDFGFNEVIGSHYTVTFSSEGKLIQTMEYDGTPLQPLALPERTKITVSITDHTTGKLVYESELFQYNGKLYNAVVDLPLASGTNNMNSNVYIKDVHFDLATQNILVGIQGFVGDNYILSVSDVTTNSKAFSIPITLQDDTFYSIPTASVQGNRFTVRLSDQHNTPIDEHQFTSPLEESTITVSPGEKELNTAVEPIVKEQPIVQEQVPLETNTVTQQPVVDPIVQQQTQGIGLSKNVIVVGAVTLILLAMLFVVISTMLKKKNRSAENANGDLLDEAEEAEEVETEAPYKNDDFKDITESESPFPKSR